MRPAVIKPSQSFWCQSGLIKQSIIGLRWSAAYFNSLWQNWLLWYLEVIKQITTAASSTAVAILNINIESLCTSIALFVFLNSPFIWITTICWIINRRHAGKLYDLKIKIKNCFFTSDCIYNEQNTKKEAILTVLFFLFTSRERAYIKKLCELFITRYFLLKMLFIDLLSLEQTKAFF